MTREQSTLTLFVPHNRKKTLIFECADLRDASCWYDAMYEELSRVNIEALKHGTRAPEVVEWYYQKQAENQRNLEVLTPEIMFTLYNNHTKTSFQSTVCISLNTDKMGLLFRIQEKPRAMTGQSITTPTTTRAKKLSPLESVLDGRVLLWAEILGYEITNNSTDQGFAFTLFSTEDQIHLEYFGSQSQSNSQLDNPSNAALVNGWLTSLHSVVSFSTLIPPSASSTNLSVNPAPLMSLGPSGLRLDSGGINDFRMNSNVPSTRTSVSGLGGLLSMNSGAIFRCSGDVAIFLENLHECELVTRHGPKFECITRLSRRFTDLFQMLGEVKHNREAVTLLGERLEEAIYLLGDSRVGVLVRYTAVNKYWMDTRSLILLSAGVSELDDKLMELVAYMHVNCNDVGWLLAAIKNSTQLRVDLERFDSSIALLVSEIINLAFSQHTVPDDASNRHHSSKRDSASGNQLKPSVTREYTMVVDVQRSMEDLCNTGPSISSSITGAGLSNNNNVSLSSSSSTTDSVSSSLVLFDNIEMILLDPAKVKAFARLIQSDPDNVHSELTLLHRHKEIFQSDYNDVTPASGRSNSIASTISNNVQLFLRSLDKTNTTSNATSTDDNRDDGSYRRTSSSGIMAPLSDVSSANNSSLFSRPSVSTSCNRPWWDGLVSCCVFVCPMCFKKSQRYTNQIPTNAKIDSNTSANTSSTSLSFSGNKSFSKPVPVGNSGTGQSTGTGTRSAPYYHEPLLPASRSIDSSTL